MPYGLIYFAEFNTISAEPLNYRLDIYKKDYDGANSEITLTAGGCVQEWQDDNPMEPIKGCTLKVGILNDGTISLEDFYSEADDEFYVELTRVDTNQCLFRGYVLQDDCQEVVVEYAHEINIVATDNLGTLKSVTLNEAAKNFGELTTITSLSIGWQDYNPGFYTDDTRIGVIVAGQIFTISGTTQYDGTYRCTNIYFDAFLNKFVISTDPVFAGSGSMSFENADITYESPFVANYVRLIDLVKLCLKSTNIDCGLKVISQLYADGGGFDRWMDSTVILAGSFQNNDSWDSCYDVLHKIMARFRASCFQSKGEWYIVRWGEYFNRKQAGTNPPFSLIGYNYNNDFEFVSEYYGNDFFSINENDIATGLIKSIIRPYKNVTETFNFNQQSSLIVNTDLQDLGALRTQYASGSNTIYEYEPNFWTKQSGSDGYIRITKDVNNKEIAREIIVIGGIYANDEDLLSTKMQVNAGSKIKVSFDFKITDNVPGVYYVYFKLVNFNGTTEYTLRNNLQFEGPGSTTTRVRVEIPPGDNVNQWHSFDVEAVLPYDGTFYFYLPQIYSGGTGNQSIFRNIRVIATGIYLNNETIVGQKYDQAQFTTIKNSLSDEILIDNAPSGIIRGALFIDQETGGIQQLANNWIVKSGLPFTIPVTLSVDPEIPNVINYNGCNLELVVDEYITLANFPEGWNAEYRVTSFTYDEINESNIIGLNADITNIGPFPENGLLTYTQANQVFNSLGEYTVKEQLFNFRKPWYKYNGTLLKINTEERMITNLSSFYFNDEAYNNSNIMLFGSLSIDYRNEAIDFTLWAMFEQLIDPWCDFSNFEDATIYNFTYIYDIKQ